MRHWRTRILTERSLQSFPKRAFFKASFLRILGCHWRINLNLDFKSWWEYFRILSPNSLSRIFLHTDYISLATDSYSTATINLNLPHMTDIISIALITESQCNCTQHDIDISVLALSGFDNLKPGEISLVVCSCVDSQWSSIAEAIDRIPAKSGSFKFISRFETISGGLRLCGRRDCCTCWLTT